MKRFIILFAALVCALGIARTDVHAQAQIPFARLTSSVPTNGTNASQRITIGGSPTTGGFTLEWNGLVSSAITWSATNATLLANIQTALDGLFASGNTVATAVSLTAGVGTIDVTFQGAYGNEPINAVMTVISNTLDGSGTVAIASQVTGVLASYRGAAPGSSLVYTGVNPPVTYTNESTTQFSPSWEQAPSAATAPITDSTNSATGAIAIGSAYSQFFNIQYNGVGSYTIAAPTYADEGKTITIIDLAAHSDTITCATDGFNAKGASGYVLLTGATIGDNVTIHASDQHWIITGATNATNN